jgi:predicted aldo/keto reductase-like oxidoreductase
MTRKKPTYTWAVHAHRLELMLRKAAKGKTFITFAQHQRTSSHLAMLGNYGITTPVQCAWNLLDFKYSRPAHVSYSEKREHSVSVMQPSNVGKPRKETLPHDN